MQAITKLLRNKKRGISTVIVVMLSLVLIVTIVGNVILWSYQMNQIDWEKIQEKIEIIDVQSVNNSWIQNPNGYILGGSTNWVSGDISNLIIDDGDTMAFSSYFSGEDLQEFVGLDSSDIDSSFDKGIHSNFTAQRYGPDSIFDTLSETNTYLNFTVLDDGFEGPIWDENWNIISANWQEDNSPIHSGSSSAWAYNNQGEGPFTSNNLNMLGVNAIYIDFWFRKDDIESSDFTLYYYDGSSYDLIYELDIVGSDDNWLHYSEKITDSQYFISNFRIRFDATLEGGENVWVDDVLIQKENSTSFELDLEVQWTDLNFNHLNEELCIYVGILDDENLQVDYWTGSDWENLFNDLNSGWNNVSISNYLESQKFTIRFKSSSEINDVIEDSWNIDVVLLHLWTNEHLTEMEFLGQSNTEEWSKLIWNSDISWSIGSVNVIVQFYNFTSDNYSTNGSGYLNYISNNLPNIKENKTQSINLESTDFRNETGYWKIKITGIATTDIPFNSELDWIQITETQFGALVAFRNEGSLTSHVTSFWVNNSTRHQRYEIETFVSPGETISKLFENIILPDEPFTAKVTTERGNLSVFSSD